jgi:hypothetical protein
MRRMGLLNKFFRSDRSDLSDPPASGTRFEASSQEDDEAVERDASRRDLVRIVLRETMRRHAVPSEWIECRILPVVNSKRKAGMHVQLIVRQGQSSLLTYIPAFQSSMMAEVETYDPRAWDWLLSISWQFAGITAKTGSDLPGGAQWSMDTGPVPLNKAATGASAATAAAAAAGTASTDDDVMKDLEALFAIRDAALRKDGDQPDFEATRPMGG